MIKESLRISPGVTSALPRVVPPSGAMILDMFIPGGVRCIFLDQFFPWTWLTNCHVDGGWSEQPFCSSQQYHLQESRRICPGSLAGKRGKGVGQMARDFLTWPQKLSRLKVSVIMKVTTRILWFHV